MKGTPVGKRKRKAPSSELEDAKRRLLAEGASLFLAGHNAITEFKREVQATCRKVAKASLDDLAKALSVEAKMLDIEDWEWLDPKGLEASIGVTVSDGKHPPVYYDLYWRDEGGAVPSISVNADLEQNVKIAAALEKAFREKHSPFVGRTGRWVWVSKELHTQELGAVEEKLQEVVAEWIRLWEEIGGFEALARIATTVTTEAP
jgi:hypothetical protein